MKNLYRILGSCRELVFVALFMLLPHMAMATDGLEQKQAEKQCTSFGSRASEAAKEAAKADPNYPNNGLMSGVYTFIAGTTTIDADGNVIYNEDGVVGKATKKLFEAFTKDGRYKKVVNACMTLMVLFYAIGFLIGIVQPSFQQMLMRLIKMGLIFMLLSDWGWDFFNFYVVNFFQHGTDQLIIGVQNIGMGIETPKGATPFYPLDQIAGFVIQPDTLIAIMGAVFSGGPYGLSMGGLMLLAMYGFFKLILRTMQTYAVCFVARSMVLGLAPIFFIFLLFDKTKSMFMAWVNALVNLSLQPLLLFTFMSFFLVLIDSSSKQMLKSELCWTEFKNISGTSSSMAFWKFTNDADANSGTAENNWNGNLECLLNKDKANADATKNGTSKCPEFPINIIDLLSFLILIYIAERFTEVVIRISSELSNAYIGLDAGSRLDQMLSQGNKDAGNATANLNPQPAGQPKTSTGGGQNGGNKTLANQPKLGPQ